jgi:hypothetical protein
MPRKYKKKLRKVPNLRAEKALELLIESRGKKGMGEIMVEAGYSPAYATNPRQLTNSITWRELWKKCFPPKRIGSLLDKIVVEYETAGNVEDKRSLLGLLDLLFKLGDFYPTPKLRIEAYQDELNNLAEDSEAIEDSEPKPEN